MDNKNFGILPASGGLGGSTLKRILNFADPTKLTVTVRRPKNLVSLFDLRIMMMLILFRAYLNLISYASIVF